MRLRRQRPPSEKHPRHSTAQPRRYDVDGFDPAGFDRAGLHRDTRERYGPDGRDCEGRTREDRRPVLRRY